MTILALLVLFSCGSKKTEDWKNVEINRSAKDSFYLATKLVDTSRDKYPQFFDGMTAIIVPQRMGMKDDLSFEKRVGFEMPCQCVFKNDSLAVTSALAWEGGFAYVAQASRQRTANSLMLFGKNRKWAMEGKEYQGEIEIPSLKNTLVISNPFPLKEGELLYGWFDIETPLFFEITGEKEEKEGERYITRVYFSCKVSPTNLY